MKFAIVVSRYNDEITKGLLSGALKYLEKKGVEVNPEDIYDAPGAYEVPLLAKIAAKSKRYDGVIALASVVKGSTAHFEFISLGVSVGIMQGMLETEVPISFGVLTTYDQDQARQRSQDNAFNKGREAALSCWHSLNTLNKIKGIKKIRSHGSQTDIGEHTDLSRSILIDELPPEMQSQEIPMPVPPKKKKKHEIQHEIEIPESSKLKSKPE